MTPTMTAATMSSTAGMRWAAAWAVTMARPASYVHDGQQTISDYTAGAAASSPAYNYVYQSYIDEPVVRGGSIIERYAYTAYGEVTFADASGTVQAASASNNRYTYTGREWDADLSLYHYRARMYDAVAGRFINRDPLGYVDGLALYGNYFGTSSIDPLGNFSQFTFNRRFIEGSATCGRVLARSVITIEKQEFVRPATQHEYGLIVHKINFKALGHLCNKPCCKPGELASNECFGNNEVFGIVDLASGKHIWPVFGSPRRETIAASIDTWIYGLTKTGSCGSSGSAMVSGTLMLIPVSEDWVRRYTYMPPQGSQLACADSDGGPVEMNPGLVDMPPERNSIAATDFAYAEALWNCCGDNNWTHFRSNDGAFRVNDDLPPFTGL